MTRRRRRLHSESFKHYRLIEAGITSSRILMPPQTIGAIMTFRFVIRDSDRTSELRLRVQYFFAVGVGLIRSLHD